VPFDSATHRPGLAPSYLGEQQTNMVETLGVCFVLVLLARPKQRLPKAAVELFQDVNRVKSRATRAAFECLHPAAAR
jgi:hypothetical protein